jgi:hypothetical protein
MSMCRSPPGARSRVHHMLDLLSGLALASAFIRLHRVVGVRTP